ncbi:AMP-binding protein [Ammoniphilus sp. CFH 90114]|uniref:AMP-binding protein n=1 Tax=Ammoniphilus sp. CFH 90114 TaxID=2493665 RepID=UPI00100DCC96|nr:AMP-binding protein [Ammoniphilus sp. CFH 90114]RXT14647.1 long-chain fatty acid--CoA ligase [Ammoniphilus sp. CFH 90114]
MDSKPWVAHYPQQVKEHLDYPNAALTELLREAVEQYPNQKAIHFLGKTITYAQLNDKVQRFASVLKSFGVKKGDRVALMLPNCPQSVICYYGVLQIGGIVVQTNPLYMERELLHQLNDSGAKVMVCLDLVYPKVKKVWEQTKLKEVFVTGLQDFLPIPKNWLFPLIQKRKGMFVSIDYEQERCRHLQQLLKNAQPLIEQEEIDPQEDLALLQYTGGTTGVAKGVMLTHRNLVANVIQAKAWFYKARYGAEKVLAVVPFFHVYGMTVGMNFSISIAGCLVMVPRFDIPLLLKAIHKQKPTIFPGAPTMYIGLLNHPGLKKYNISSIDACLSGSAALPIEVQENFESLTEGRLVEGYGLTECSPVTHANPVWDRRKTGSIGLPWSDTEVRIIHLETGEALAPGEYGELAVRGPQVMKGYWNRPEETKAVFQGDWLLTGDIAYMDQEGYFYIVDRKKDMINASGFNVYPREVEEVLFEHKAVLEAAVVGVPDPYRGETVKAFIVLKEGAEVSSEELDEFCRKRLSAYKVPKYYEYRTELPKTMVGKVLRRMLIHDDDDNSES